MGVRKRDMKRETKISKQERAERDACNRYLFKTTCFTNLSFIVFLSHYSRGCIDACAVKILSKKKTVKGTDRELLPTSTDNFVEDSCPVTVEKQLSFLYINQPNR